MKERGLQGIENFDFTQLKGDYVINVDSDDEGVVVVGCAGGPVSKGQCADQKSSGRS